MDCIERDDKQISGGYKHFKGNLYDLFCVAYDSKGKKYILYQQCYGDKAFWIRPYHMFFENVPGESGTATPRFMPTASEREKAEDKINYLIKKLEGQSIIIHHTETEEEYVITSINSGDFFVTVHSVDNSTGYLTDFELLRRLGFSSCRINGKVNTIKNEISDEQRLTIGNNDIKVLSKQLNPCSVDLQIADDGFLVTKRCLVDPQSIETVTSADHLWKEVKIKPSRHGSRKYFKLQPGKTVLTHTKELIRVPLDCAAKIEIKSTFARLAIDITSGDFLNPGYCGYYPLEITNKGKHTIILRQGETMAQLMVIPLQGPIVENYQDKATFKDKRGIDDGTPKSFWNERAIRALRKEGGTQHLIDLYYLTLDEINTNNTVDVNETKKRFEGQFLSFCQKRITKTQFKQSNTDLPDARKLLLAFSRREKRIRNFMSIKWITGLFSVLPIALPIIKSLLLHSQKIASSFVENLILSIPLWAYLLALTVFGGITTTLFICTPRVFCTFEKMDIDKLCEKAENQENEDKKGELSGNCSA